MEQTIIKKNILDLRYSKTLQFFSTTIVALLTYFIALAVTLFTQNIEMTILAVIPFLITPIIFTGATVLILLKLSNDIKDIETEIKNLSSE